MCFSQLLLHKCLFLAKLAQSQATFYVQGLPTRWGENAYIGKQKLIYQRPLLNPGNHYSNISGVYTCPTTGVYLFVYSAHGIHIKQGSKVTASLYRDGERVSELLHTHAATNSTSITLSQAGIVACQTGEHVWVQGEWYSNYIGGRSSLNIFGGVLLYTI